jgi:hypothetical protein
MKVAKRATAGAVLLLAVLVLVQSSGVNRPDGGLKDDGDPGFSTSSTLLTADDWERRYLAQWAGQHTADYLPLSRSSDCWAQYTLAYAVDENTALYRATGKALYLNRALEYVENVVDRARPSSALPASQYRDGYRGWESRRDDTRGDELPLPESYFWRYATGLLRVMKQAAARPGARYDRLLHFAEVHVFEKWHRRGADEHLYRSRTHMAAHWAQIALNLSLLTTDSSRRALYRHVVENIDLHLPNQRTGLRSQLRKNPAASAAYFWSDEWGSVRPPGQDVAHGNGVVAYVVDAHDYGDHWAAKDIARFTALLTTVIWPRDGVFSEYVDGSGTGPGWFADGFVKLGRYDASLQWRLERHTVVNGQYAANMALNAKVLSKGAGRD